MNIAAQIKIRTGRIPGRCYLHNCGIEAYGGKPFALAKADFLEALEKIEITYPWSIGILWGDNGVRVTEIFAFGGIKSWPGNPDIVYYQFRNGEFAFNPLNLTCGDGLRVLGREEDFRRTTGSLDDFLSSTPKFSGREVKNFI
jgi:hypothetical protein